MKLLTFSRVRFAIFIVVLHKLCLLRAACAMLACTLIMLVVRQRATLYVQYRGIDSRKRLQGLFCFLSPISIHLFTCLCVSGLF